MCASDKSTPLSAKTSELGVWFNSFRFTLAILIRNGVCFYASITSGLIAL